MIRAILSDDASAMEKELGSLPDGFQIIAIYGLNGRHVAWVKLPGPVSKIKTEKKGIK
jgi:hypothetical protein